MGLLGEDGGDAGANGKIGVSVLSVRLHGDFVVPVQFPSSASGLQNLDATLTLIMLMNRFRSYIGTL